MKNFFRLTFGLILLGIVILHWSQAGVADRGEDLFNEKCSLCHGEDGKGKGPGAAAFNPGPADFNTPRFWQGDARNKIINSIKNGQGTMQPVAASDTEIQAIIGYMEKAFKP